MDISEFTKQNFSESFLPRWVGIDACFCFCHALLAGQEDSEHKSDDTRSVIDLSLRLDSYPAPTATQLRANDSQFETKVDQLIRELLESGAVRVRARNEFCELDYDYTKFRSVDDLWESDSGKHWHPAHTIDYKNRQVILHDDPEGFLERCIIDYDYDIQTTGHGELIREVQSGIVDIEVFREDLITSLSSWIGSYRIPDPSTTIEADVRAVTGKNRFIYSAAIDRWIVEYRGKVETYPAKEGSAELSRLQYLLKYPLTSQGISYQHLYSSVDILGYSHEVTDEMEEFSQQERLSISSSQKIDHDDADEELATYRQARSVLVSRIKENPRRKDLHKQLEAVEDYIKKNTYQGRAKVRTDQDKVKNKVKTALTRAIKRLKLDETLQEHLVNNITREANAIYYCSDQEWITTG